MKLQLPTNARRSVAFLLLATSLTIGCRTGGTPAESGAEAAKAAKSAAPGSIAGTALSSGPLAAELDPIFLNDKFSGAHWGVRIETLDGRVLYDLNGTRCFVPASNMKLITTAAALDLLGPDHVYETRLLHTGQIGPDGSLHGDLVIVGSGDPSLGAWHPDEDRNSAQLFDEWIRKINEAGIRSVHGDIIGDGTCFTEEYIHPEWVYWDLPYWYAAGSSGLAMEENAFRCYIEPGPTIGSPARITFVPQTTYITFVNETKTVAAGGESDADIVWRLTEGNHFRFARNVALDKEKFRERGSVWDGARYAAYLLKEALERKEITVHGEAKNLREYPDLNMMKARIFDDSKLIAVHTSPPLSEQARVVNLNSHNFFADQIFRTIGLEKRKEGSFDAGSKAVAEWMKEIGTPAAETYRQVDGSGLAQINMVQPRQFTHLLARQAKTDTPATRAFRDSMSLAGEQGWLPGGMPDDPLTKGKIRAKTGFIEYRRALSGYAQTASGEEVVFSIIANHHAAPLKDVDEATASACKLMVGLDLSRFSRNP